MWLPQYSGIPPHHYVVYHTWLTCGSVCLYAALSSPWGFSVLHLAHCTVPTTLTADVSVVCHTKHHRSRPKAHHIHHHRSGSKPSLSHFTCTSAEWVTRNQLICQTNLHIKCHYIRIACYSNRTSSGKTIKWTEWRRWEGKVPPDAWCKGHLEARSPPVSSERHSLVHLNSLTFGCVVLSLSPHHSLVSALNESLLTLSHALP